MIQTRVPGAGSSVAAIAASAAAGMAIALKPRMGTAVIGLVLAVALVAMPAVPRLVALVALTAVVPYGVQNRFGIGGGPGSPGLLLSDVLLATGLVAVAAVVLSDPGRWPRPGISLAVAGFVACVGVQLVRGLALGRPPSTAGQEFRGLFGFAAFFIALPVVRREDGLRRLFAGLLVVGVALGLWGLAQWFLHVGFAEVGDVGVRHGVRFTTAGRGQLQGGLYAFPVAVLLSLAVFLSGRLRSGSARLAVGAVLVLNAVCLLVTYERTFWLATAAGAVFLVAKAGAGRSGAVALWGLVTVVAVFGFLEVTAPGDVTAARERLQSLNQYQVDNSVQYRLTESRHVVAAITEHPVTGSGLGATIFWGRPWALVPPASFTFSHNGYLWLAWKLGVPAAALLALFVGTAVAGPTPPLRRDLAAALRAGCRASLLALVIVAFTFPSFSQLAITTTTAVLVAVSVGAG